MRRFCAWLFTADHGLVTGLWLLGLSLASLAFLVGVCTGTALGQGVATQPYRTLYRHVIIPVDVRRDLAAEWDDTTAQQVERAYCVAYHVDYDRTGVLLYIVDALLPAYFVTDATPYHVTFACQPGAARLHTHTPTTCEQPPHDFTDYATCYRGGPDAYQCEPSPLDRAGLIRRSDPFALIQCGRFAVAVFYLEPLSTIEGPGR